MAASDELRALAAALSDLFIGRSAAGLVLLDVHRGNGFHVSSFLDLLGFETLQDDAFQPIAFFGIRPGSKLFDVGETEFSDFF